jgi:hypothetical protein
MSTPKLDPDSPQAKLDAWSGRQVRIITRHPGSDPETTVGQLDVVRAGFVAAGDRPVGLYSVGSLRFDLYATEEEPEIEDGRVVVKLADGTELTVEPA